MASAMGCARTRSISNSGYHAEHGGPFGHRGELNEFDVLGIRPQVLISEDDIQEALQRSRPIQLTPASTILVVQSGAMFPDAPMVESLSQYFRVIPFSGLPPESKREEGAAQSSNSVHYFESLRLAAARSGSVTILVYWGVLESAREDLATKTVSWVPVVNWLVPDERQHMRLRLKLVLIDVRSGNWTEFSPDAIRDATYSTKPRREAVDQRQVDLLKDKAYRGSVRQLVRSFVREGS